MSNVVVITGVPADTKGDFYAAKKLIQELISSGASVEWILQFEDPSQWANLSSVANQLGPNCTTHPLKAYSQEGLTQKSSQDLTLNTQYLVNDILENAEKMSQRDLVIVFPSVRSLREIDYQALSHAKANVLCINEYGYGHKLHTSRPEIVEMLAFHKRNGTDLQSTGLSDDSLGIFKKTDNVPSDLSHAPLEDQHFIRRIIGTDNALFFSYTNTLVPGHDEDLARYFLLCVKQALQEKKNSVDLIGRVNSNVVELLKEYLKNEFEEMPDIKIRLFNPFPIKNQTMLAFMQQAKIDKHPALLTGDQSTGEGMVIGAPFIYQVGGWKIPFFHQMLELCDNNNFHLLKRFLILTHLGHFYDDKISKNGALQNIPNERINTELLDLLSNQNLYDQYSILINHVKSFEDSLKKKIEIAALSKTSSEEIEGFLFPSEITLESSSATTTPFKPSVSAQKESLVSEFNACDLSPKKDIQADDNLSKL